MNHDRDPYSWVTKIVDEPSTQIPFSVYLDHFVVGGMSGESTQALTSFLERLYEISGQHWLPGECRSIPQYVDRARDLAASLPGNPSVRIMQRRLLHFWLELDMGDRVIVDPTGVMDFGKNDIRPFFGPLNATDGYLRETYFQGEALTEDDIRNLTSLGRLFVAAQ